MECELKIGNIVWVYKIGCEGEIVDQVGQEYPRRYHIRIPADNNTYVYGKEDLFVFGPEAAENIRNEWKQLVL